MIRKKVGFIGSGYMGFGMAKNLIKNSIQYIKVLIQSYNRNMTQK